MQHSCAPPSVTWVLLQANQSIAWIWLLERQKQLSAATALLTASVTITASFQGMIEDCAVVCCNVLSFARNMIKMIVRFRWSRGFVWV
jgi:hypothetical protein